jgi:hypothetical protein
MSVCFPFIHQNWRVKRVKPRGHRQFDFRHKHSDWFKRWRNKKAIATGFVESAVNQIVSLLNAWKIPFVTGIRTKPESEISRRLKLSTRIFYALH